VIVTERFSPARKRKKDTPVNPFFAVSLEKNKSGRKLYI